MLKQNLSDLSMDVLMAYDGHLSPRIYTPSSYFRGCLTPLDLALHVRREYCAIGKHIQVLGVVLYTEHPANPPAMYTRETQPM